MGSKKLLAPRLAELVSEMEEGPFLDLFSGIAAVGTQIASNRQVWCNDVQRFSNLLTKQRFGCPKAFTSCERLIVEARTSFYENQAALSDIFSGALSTERQAMSSMNCAMFLDLIKTVDKASALYLPQLRSDRRSCLFVTSHGGTYFGVQQAIDIDSVRHAADTLRARGAIEEYEHGWMVLALCRVLSTISNSTGHFAQYLSPSSSNVRRVVRKRRMDVWKLWAETLRELQPIGTVAWRRGNRLFDTDAVTLLKRLSKRSRHPTVIYADPPYTSDQYSRYYHVLENIVLYDYPKLESKGQYRENRFTSGFSLKSEVSSSFEDMASAASKLDSVFILSYPSNGLLGIDCVNSCLLRHFNHVDSPIVLPHLHSTMGASKGLHKQSVDENIIVAYQDPRKRRVARSTLPRANTSTHDLSASGLINDRTASIIA